MLLVPGQQTDGSGTQTPGYTSQGGVLLPLAANQTIATGATNETALTWHATATWDPDTIWTGGASATFTVPSGWTHCRIICGVFWTANGTGTRRALATVNGNKNPLYGGNIQSNPDDATIDVRQNFSSGVIPVSSGDTIQIVVDQTSGGNLDVVANNGTWVAILKWNTTLLTHVSLGTAQTIATGTKTELGFDTIDSDPLGMVREDQKGRFQISHLGGQIHRIFAGIQSESNNESWRLRFKANDEGTDYHQSYAASECREAVANTNSLGWECLTTGAVRVPSVHNIGDIIALEVQHDHGSDLDIQDAYMQIEKAKDAFSCIFYMDDDQTASTGVNTVIDFDELISRAPGGFIGGTTGAITVPAVPGGGSWEFAIVTCTVKGGGLTQDRGLTMQLDTGGGFGGWAGQGLRLQQSSTISDPIFHLTCILPSPTAGDEIRALWFQNIGVNETLEGTSSNRETAFTMELFKA